MRPPALRDTGKTSLVGGDERRHLHNHSALQPKNQVLSRCLFCGDDPWHRAWALQHELGTTRPAWRAPGAPAGHRRPTPTTPTSASPAAWRAGSARAPWPTGVLHQRGRRFRRRRAPTRSSWPPCVKREQRAAADIVGYEDVTFLHRPDGALANDLALREQLVRIIRTFRPDAVAASDPRVLIHERGFVNHVDHREAGAAAIDAVYPAAQNAMAFPHLVTVRRPGAAPRRAPVPVLDRAAQRRGRHHAPRWRPSLRALHAHASQHRAAGAARCAHHASWARREGERGRRRTRPRRSRSSTCARRSSRRTVEPELSRARCPSVWRSLSRMGRTWPHSFHSGSSCVGAASERCGPGGRSSAPAPARPGRPGRPRRSTAAAPAGRRRWAGRACCARPGRHRPGPWTGRWAPVLGRRASPRPARRRKPRRARAAMTSRASSNVRLDQNGVVACRRRGSRPRPPPRRWRPPAPGAAAAPRPGRCRCARR